MDLAALEFPAIVERLAAATGTAYGEELALAPANDAGEVARRQALTAEVVGLLDESLEPPLEGIHDVRSAAEHAARGATLGADALRRIADTIAGGVRARGAIS